MRTGGQEIFFTLTNKDMGEPVLQVKAASIKKLRLSRGFFSQRMRHNRVAVPWKLDVRCQYYNYQYNNKLSEVAKKTTRLVLLDVLCVMSIFALLER